MGKTQLPLSGRAGDLRQFRVDKHRLVLLWSCRLEIYDFEDGVLGGRVFSDSFASMGAEYADVKVEGELVAYAVGRELRVFDFSASAFVAKYAGAETIDSVAIVGDYIVTRSSAAIRQYDYRAKTVISSLPRHSTHAHKMLALGNNGIIDFVEDRQLQILSVSPWYECLDCSSCASTYHANGSRCIKKYNNNGKSASNTRILEALPTGVPISGDVIQTTSL